MAPKKPRTKDIASGSGSGSGKPQSMDVDLVPTIPVNWKISTQNRYLFIDDKAYRDYTGSQGGVAECFYIAQGDSERNEERIQPIVWDLIQDRLKYLNCEGLIGCCQPYNVEVIKLFYANLRVIWNEGIPTATSYICGKPIKITYKQVCDTLRAKDEGKKVYFSKTWPRESEIEPFEKYHEFFYCWRDYNLKQFSATELPALHRFFFLIINNILAPKKQIKTNVEFREVFYLRCLIEQNPRLNIPYIFFMHMEKAARTRNMSLPFGNVISLLLVFHGIPPQFKVFGRLNDAFDPGNLISTLLGTGWVLRDTRNNILSPDPEFARNKYLFQHGAKLNQYAPVGQEPTGPLRGPNVPQQSVNVSSFDTRLSNLEKEWADWKAADTTWKAEDAVWKQSCDNRIQKVESDIQDFWGNMQREFKKTRAHMRAGSSSAGAGEEEWSEDDE